MVGSRVAITIQNKQVEGYVTDVVPHDDGSTSYEILADGRCHYLQENQFSVTGRLASARANKIASYDAGGSVRHDLETVASRAPEPMRKALRELIGKYC